MEIKFENIILRDMIESDIDDYVRWFTTETEWSKTDAPWEPIESDDETERASWQEYYESVKDLPDDVRRWKFEIEWNGRHIGWVSSYPIDEHYEWIGEIQDGQTVYRAIGIDICEPDVWGKGVGTNALRAFMNYYFENGVDELYTQTWSGNVRMLRCADPKFPVQQQTAVHSARCYTLHSPRLPSRPLSVSRSQGHPLLPPGDRSRNRSHTKKSI